MGGGLKYLINPYECGEDLARFAWPKLMLFHAAMLQIIYGPIVQSLPNKQCGCCRCSEEAECTPFHSTVIESLVDVQVVSQTFITARKSRGAQAKNVRRKRKNGGVLPALLQISLTKGSISIRTLPRHKDGAPLYQLCRTRGFIHTTDQVSGEILEDGSHTIFSVIIIVSWSHHIL